jgi:hypothetical protein
MFSQSKLFCAISAEVVVSLPEKIVIGGQQFFIPDANSAPSQEWQGCQIYS